VWTVGKNDDVSLVMWSMLYQ